MTEFSSKGSKFDP